MLPAYIPLRDQLAADIEAAWNPKTIYFGAPAAETEPGDVVVELDVSREFNGLRSVQEVYTWTIAGKFARPAPGTDLLTTQVALASALGDRLAPSDPVTVPTPAGGYGGAGYDPRVTAVEMPPMRPEDDHFIVGLTFSVASDVLQ